MNYDKHEIFYGNLISCTFALLGVMPDDTEDFAFVFSRTNNPEANTFGASSDYTVYLLQGWDKNEDEDYQNYVVARYSMSDGFIPSFVLDADKSSGRK